MKNNKINKFIQLVPEVYPGVFMYKEDYFLWPADMMKKKGYDVEFVTVGRNRKKMEVYGGMRVKRFQNSLQLLRYLINQKQVMIHSHLRSFFPAIVISLFKKHTIHTPHNYQLGSNFLIRALTIFLFKRFSRVVALTPYEQGVYLRKGIPKKKVVYLPHAIDYSYFSKSHRKKRNSSVAIKLGIKNSDFVILTVANYRKVKRMETLLNAFKLIKRKDIKLIIVGEDLLAREGEPTLKEIVGSLELKNVKLVGRVNQENTRDYYGLADLFVSTSESESMNLSVYEAAAAGLPLCLSDIGSFTSVFSDNALYHHHKDSKKLADNILQYFNNPYKRKMDSKRLQRLVKKFDFSIIYNRMKKLYGEVLKSGA